MNIAVIFAGGVGSRMQATDVPKQFLTIHGKPILVRTVEQFSLVPEIDSIVVVSNGDWLEHTRKLLAQYQLDKVSLIVPGGESGQESIYNGLLAAEKLAAGSKSVVLIHDGVRPIITTESIQACIESVTLHGSAVTAVPCTETVAISTDGLKVNAALDREELWLLRAPQCFYLSEILEAHNEARVEKRFDYIDSATMMADKGKVLHLVAGSPQNIKVTTQSDFFAIQAILNAEENTQLEYQKS